MLCFYYIALVLLMCLIKPDLLLSCAGNNNSTLFDASQYEFFGQSLEEVELGGLYDDADSVLGHADDGDGYHLFDKREVILD